MKILIFLALLFFIGINKVYSATFVMSPDAMEVTVNYPQMIVLEAKGYAVYDPNGVPDIRGNVGGGGGPNDVCSYISGCVFGPTAKYGFRRLSGGTIFYATGEIRYGSPTLITPQGTSWSDAVTMWKEQYGNTRVAGYSSYDPRYYEYVSAELCFGWERNDGSSSNRNIDWSSCRSAPPPRIDCQITTPSILLDHGDLVLGQVNGSVKASQFNVRCNGNVTAQYNILPTGPIVLKPGLSSTITVDNKALGSDISLRVGDNILPIASTLADTGATAGSFESTVVLMQSFQ
ncbi:hypothetical protein ACOZB2_22165 [Pantoea endophytica]|uniref:Fimbrial protein n=1 Tax=Pantoea sp. BJ2 TaxID=3141322 RepID=A0AAU7TVP2_9GAMM